MGQFIKKYSFTKRLEESSRILKKFPNRIPIILEKYNSKGNIPEINKTKYLVSSDLTVGQFIYVIRKKLNLKAEQAIFLFIDNTLPLVSSTIGIIYEQHRNKDRFLYVTYSDENTFGTIN